MTDAALADSGPMPDLGGAPIADSAPSFSSPLGSQIPEAGTGAADKGKPVSLDDSIARAEAKVLERNAAKEQPKADAKPEAKEPPKDANAKPPASRDETGKFAAKQPAAETPAQTAQQKQTEQVKPSHTADDAPSRFTETAKAKWHAADPEIRGETLRMQRELTQGYEKHKASAEAFETYRELDDIAKQSGKKGAEVFREYYNMENELRKNPIGGLNLICERLGFSLRDVAAHVMGQTPDQNASQQDATIRELRQQNSSLEARLNKLEGGFNEQREQSTLTEIQQFASDPAHARFEELADDIAFFMKSGRAKDLADAYQLAERLNPAPQAKVIEEDPPPASSAAALAQEVQTDKGTKSINGAPSTGSNPGAKKRQSRTLDESLDAAFGRAG